MLLCNVVKLNTQANFRKISIQLLDIKSYCLYKNRPPVHTGALTTASSHTQRLHYLEGLHPCSFIKLGVKLLPDCELDS